VQFAVPTPGVRYLIAIGYTVLALALLVHHRRELPALIRAARPTARDTQR
jgi:hypothetical protein